jgi:hypothetical protein
MALWTAVTIFGLLFNLVLPAMDFTARAQEATEEPAPVTEAPTLPAEQTAEPTVAPTEAPTNPPLEATAEPTAAPTEVTAVPTDVATDEPTATPTSEPTPTLSPIVTVFSDDFQDANTEGWTLTPGWQIGVEGKNLFLMTGVPNESASIANLSVADFSFALRARISDGSRLNITFRAGAEAYLLSVDMLGNALLYRNSELVAQGAPQLPPAEGIITPPWNTVNIHALGAQIIVVINGVQQIVYNDAAPLPIGGILLSSDAASLGVISIDQVLVGQVDIPVLETPVVEPTAAPTSEATPDVTATPEPEATAEAPPEVTAEPPFTGTLLLSADFESEPLGWALSESLSIVQDSESNHALLMAAGSAFMPAETIYVNDLRLGARVNITGEVAEQSANGVGFTFRTQEGQGYAVFFGRAQTELYRNDGSGTALLASAPAERALYTWYALTVEALGGTITVSVDGSPVVSYDDASPLVGGSLAFLANASVLLDDITVTDVAPQVIDLTPTAVPFALSDAERGKLNDALANALVLHMSGDAAGALDLARASFLPVDENGRLQLVLWASEGSSGAAIASLVAAVGGQVDHTGDYNIEGRIPLDGLIALVNAPDVALVEPAAVAVSTSPQQSPAEAPAVDAPPTGTAITEGYDVLSVNDWHNLGTGAITGTGQRIAVIDTGFVGMAAVAAGERACLGAIPAAGTGNHGVKVVQVICDIAPDADVFGYVANTAATLADQVALARTQGSEIIVITMDLGVNAAPGDGTDGAAAGVIDSVYDEIRIARDAGILVIVSAGNNFGRMASFTYTGTAVSITITGSAGDKVNLSWNDWASAPNGGGTAEDIDTSGLFTKPNRAVNAPPSYQHTLVADCAPCTLNLTGLTGSAIYLQVQVTGTATIDDVSGVAENTTNTIGRPADSPDALTVGAVCWDQTTDPTHEIMSDSSRGPIFGNGGSAPPAGPFTSRSQIKPDLVGPSHVSTSFDLNIPSLDTGVNDPCNTPEPTDGFNGTSAAAAHVAAMAALLRSNTSLGLDTPDELTDYMQSHAIDLYERPEAPGVVEPDGFDTAFGAGLAVLGSPTPGTLSVDHNTLANVACVTGPTVYVSPYSLSTDERALTTLGTRDNPYIHPAQALAAAATGACVVLVPGEYVSGITLDSTMLNNDLTLQAYQITSPAAAPSVLWVNNGGNFGAGFTLINMTENFTLRGVQFIRANPLVQRVDGTLPFPTRPFLAPKAFNVDTVTGTTLIERSLFTMYDDLNVATTTRNNEPPIEVRASSNITIQNNTFSNNDSDAAGLRIIDSGSGTTISTTVQYNSFVSNTSSITSGLNSAPIQIIRGTANIVSNRFTQNSTRSIITVQNVGDPNTPPNFAGANEVNILGNAIFNNANTGPVIKLSPARRVRFSNNTVAGNEVMSSTYVIERGEDNGTNESGLLEANNNIFYNNRSVLGLFQDGGTLINDTCRDFTGTNDSGFKNNWSESSGGPGTGDCQNSLTAFNNQIDEPLFPMGELDTPSSVFIGNTVPADPYQLKQGTYGVDGGNNGLVPAFFLTVLDALRKQRVEGTVPETIDLGAYEYIDIAAGPIAVLVTEDDPPVSIDMTVGAIGGFAPYTFEVVSPPANYSTDVSNACLGQPVRGQGNIFTYCLPNDFYTVGAPTGASANFTYRVRDVTGAVSDPATVTIDVNPLVDQPLTTGVTYNIVLEGHEGPGTQAVAFRLRPYARFDNYRIIRPNDESDYPYTYAFGALTGTFGQNTNLFAGDLGTAINGATDTGLVTLNMNPNQVGFIEFTYNATDANGNTTDTVNTVRITVVASLPDAGLHDDTSFAFFYHGLNTPDQGNWTPIYNEISINNTLHTSLVKDDTAEFLFNGTAFALYMQASALGGNWELQIDNGGSPLRFNWNGAKVATTDGVTCRTSAVTKVATTAVPDLKYYISNLGTAPYVVSCTGLLEGEPNTVRIINRENRNVSIDAIGILTDERPLLPGFHEVTETQLVNAFSASAWVLLTDTRASGQRAYVTTNAAVPDLRFRFKGTGFALGTTLETNLLRQGAKYKICVTEVANPTNEICQNFDSTLGGTTIPVFNVFRPFFGFDPASEYDVTVDVTDLPAQARFVVDSIVVYDQQPTEALPLGTTEDDQLGSIVFSGGMQDNWLLNTADTRASNRSLTTISALVKAGPFVSFQIPANADVINWQRVFSAADSANVLVCVDRAQFEATANHCKEYNLRLVGSNPLVIKESDFTGGWGTGFGTASTHTVEIFSLTNFAFNVDRFQVLTSSQPLVAGSYEQTVPNIQYFNETSGFPFTGSSFVTINDTRASGGSYARGTEGNEGIFFRFTGTGFAPVFTLDRYANNVLICWLEDPGLTATVTTVLASPTCQTISNAGVATLYGVARSFVGLENSTYAVVVQHKGTNYNAVTRTGNTMQIDAVRVYNDDWTTLTPLAVGRTETSYTNRVTQNNFIYYGTTWKSFTGTAAKLYSGQNYDNILAFGAGVVFQTTGGNVVRIVRDTRAGAAPLQVCTAPTDDFTPFTCSIVRNDGGTGNQQIFSIPLSGTNAHVVSVTTLTAGVFNLDAIEVANNTPALTAGTYPETDARISYTPINTLTTGWRNMPLASYVDKSAIQSTADGAQMTFSFTGTGFSLFTRFDTLESVLDVDIDGTGSNDYLNQVFSNTRAGITYGSTHSITGLTFDTYTVTITENDAKNRFTVDGVQIYADYAVQTSMTPGIYDDAALNELGSPYLTFGPFNAWTTRTTAGYLNLTNRLSTRHGANISFEVEDAGYITLFHTGTTSTSLRVCAKPVAATSGSASWFCGTTTNPSTRANTTISLNNAPANIQLNAGGEGEYFISITQLTHATNFVVDAVGVYPGSAPLEEGIHQENHPLLTFTGTWGTGSVAEASATDKWVRSTGTGDTNDQLSFQFSGTGFSIVLSEGTPTSTSYTLCVENGGSCNVINAALAPVTPSPAKRPVALTYVGFAFGTYTVRLTNNDSAKPLLIDRVDILGNTTTDIAADITGNVENTDSRLRYFPHFSFTPTNAAAASGGSQHFSSMQGAVVYFELNAFAGSGVQYARQTSSAYGVVTTCANTPGTNSTTCNTTQDISNKLSTPLPFGYQRIETVNVNTGSRYVTLRNSDGKPMPVDFIRPLVAGEPLTTGYYEENHPSLLFFTENGGSYTVLGAGDDGNFVDLAQPAASGGSVKVLSADEGGTGNGLNEGMLFQFNGRGFGIKFTLDNKADAIRVCWVNFLSNFIPTILGGTCQTIDNQSAAVRYQAVRLFQGLSAGDHTVIVQMLADNNTPAPHTTATLPLKMQIDAVEVYGDDWTGLTALPAGTKIETSYVNRVADDRFFYYGNGWRSVSGTAAKLYSGQNYDSIANVIGAGVTFQTTGANALVLFRDTRAGYAPLLVCSSPTGAITQRYCTIVTNTAPTGVSQPARIFLNDPAWAAGTGAGQRDHLGPHVVTISTLDVGVFNLDAIQPVNTTVAMQPGFYEDTYPALTYTGTWSEVYLTTYTGGRAQQNTEGDPNGGELNFSFTNGVGFEVGIPTDRYGGEVEICYDTDNDWNDATNQCYTYQHESTRVNFNTTRSVAGLNPASTYFVRVKNSEDGQTVIPPIGARPATYSPARLRIDFVQIYAGTLPPVVNSSGLYNENAASSGVPYLQLLPESRWLSISGTVARLFSGSSYAAVTDNARRAASALYAGPVATLRVNVPAGGATVVLYTGTAIATNTDQLLVCANNVDDAPAGSCTVITNLRTQNQLVLTSTQLTALGSPGTVTLTFRALTPGLFRIDGFQVIHGTLLTPGVYDDFLGSAGGILNLTNNGAGVWSAPTKVAGAYGGTIISANSTNATTDDPTLRFTFLGTGFSILTLADSFGVDLQICYAATDGFDGDFDVGTSNEKCEIVTTDTNTLVADWNQKNDGRPRPSVAQQYGFAVYGLPTDPGAGVDNTYQVRVRMIDTVVVATDRLKIDAIAIFSDVTNAGAATPLAVGTLHDNTQTGIVYESVHQWTQTTLTLTPPRGPWNRTQSTATAGGALMQLYVEGNAVVLYQYGAAINSRQVRVCVRTIEGLDCTEFSQAAARPTYFTPVVIYGLGSASTHQVFVENRDHGRTMNIDAIRVME